MLDLLPVAIVNHPAMLLPDFKRLDNACLVKFIPFVFGGLFKCCYGVNFTLLKPATESIAASILTVF